MNIFSKKSTELIEKSAFLGFLIGIPGIMYIFLSALSFSRTSFFQDHIENFSVQKSLSTFLIFSFLLLHYGLLVCWNRSRELATKYVTSFWLTLFLVLLTLLFLVTPPLLSRDTLGYVLRGSNFVEYGKNPYTTPLNGVPENPWMYEVEQELWWMDGVSLYGPLFNILTASVVLLGPKNILLTIALYKLLCALSFFLGFFVIRKILNTTQDEPFPIVLYALNPTLLIHGVLEGHNEVFLLTALLGALYYHLTGRWRVSMMALGVAVAIKYIPIILLPIYWLKNKKILLKEVLLSVGYTSILFIAFSSFFHFPFQDMFRALRAYPSGCLYTCSPFVSFINILFDSTAPLVRIGVSGILFLQVTYYYLWQETHTTLPIFRFVFWTLFVLIFVFSTWLAPWYVLLIIPLALLLSPHVWYDSIVYVLTMYSLYHYFGL